MPGGGTTLMRQFFPTPRRCKPDSRSLTRLPGFIFYIKNLWISQSAEKSNALYWVPYYFYLKYMRILIVEDDQSLMQQLRKNLESKSFAVDTAENGEDGSFMARVNDYDLIVLNDSLPKKNGTDVCRDIRNANKTAPIIAVSDTDNLQQKISLLHEGADDHLTKPFSFEELLARIQAILRRPPLKHKPILGIDTVKLDCRNQMVTRGEKKVYLTRKEFALLEYLMRNKGSIVSRSMIMEHVWNDETDPFSNTIESHILNLRKKIDSKRRRLIHNVPGRGYKMDVLR